MKRKRILSLLAAGILLVLAGMILPMALQVPLIGSVSGAEREYMEVRGTSYLRADFANEEPAVMIADWGRYLGAVQQGDTRMRVFTVKGSDRYLYVLWDWEGSIYVQQE